MCSVGHAPIQVYQQHMQHPLLSAISGNNYDETQRTHYPWHQQHSHHFPPNPYVQHGRPLLAAASNHNGAYASAASGHSGYGIEPSLEYEVPPSGSYSPYHPSGSSNDPAYPPPHPPAHHAPKSAPTTSASKKKRSSSSVMSALTLLSFFFFVNMLQSCIKEHITDMNPTVMVLTSSGSRNRFNKLAEMNSREQTSSPASTTASESAAAAAEVVASWPVASSAIVPVIVTPAVTLHTPYSSGLMTNKPALHSHSDRQQQPYMDTGYPWSYGPNANSQSHSQPHSHSQSHSHSHAVGSKRYSSSASLGAQSGVSSYSDNARYGQDDDDQRYSHVHDDDNAAAGQRRRVDFYTRNNN
ncbi:uncharacterized protein LOC117789456 [Drosophila innubila]|uniref:uncharacterized protein LOC117789456 n=1 Tax=Drosophila innubila TaxID=198719 RepID=UPI00148E0D9D|nr:uncharacterized protein LOC117789456 [Drosophila innubila]